MELFRRLVGSATIVKSIRRDCRNGVPADGRTLVTLTGDREVVRLGARERQSVTGLRARRAGRRRHDAREFSVDGKFVAVAVRLPTKTGKPGYGVGVWSVDSGVLHSWVFTGGEPLHLGVSRRCENVGINWECAGEVADSGKQARAPRPETGAAKWIREIPPKSCVIDIAFVPGRGRCAARHSAQSLGYRQWKNCP